MVVSGLLMYLTAWLSRYWIIDASHAQAFWPPAGVLVGLTLIVPTGRRAAVLLGSLVGDGINNWRVFHTTGFADNLEDVAVSVVLFIVAAVIGRPALRYGRTMDRKRAAIAAVVASFLITLPAALAARLFVDQLTTLEDVLTWWVGDALGVALVGGSILICFFSPVIAPLGSKRHRLEFALVFAALAASTWFGFRTELPVVLLAIGLLAWVAVRFGIRASLPSAMVMVTLATLRTSQGHGPFVFPEYDNILPLQPFNIAVTVVALGVAAAAQEIHEHDKWTQNLLDGLPDILTLIDHDGRIIAQPANDKFPAIPSIVGRTVHNLRPGELLASLRGNFELVRKPGHYDAGHDEVIDSEGELRLFESRVVQLDRDTELAISRDVTRHEQLARAITQSDLRWRNYLATSQEGMLEIDADLVVVSVSQRFVHEIGLAEDDLVGHRLTDLFSRNIWTEWEDSFQRVRDGHAVVFETSYATAGKPDRWALVSARPTVDEKGAFAGAIMLATDTTRLRRAEAARRQAEVRLVHVELEERSRIGSQLHDGPIQDLAAVNLQLGLIDADESNLERIRAIEATVERVVADLRGGLRELVPPSVSTGQLLDALGDVSARLIRGSAVSINIRGDFDLAPRDAPAVALFSIVREAIGNAIAHGDAQRVDVVVGNVDGGFEITVTDDGRGFDVENWTAERDHLGIRSMRDRAAEMGGSCRIERHPSGGMVVTAWIPGRTRIDLHRSPSAPTVVDLSTGAEAFDG